MKISLYFTCLIIGLNSHAQNNKTTNISIEKQNSHIHFIEDENEFLNNDEGNLLNNLFNEKRNDIDLRNKKIGFISGPSGNKKYSKTHYFASLKKHEHLGNLIIFDNNEKKISKYDAVIIYWSKIAPTKKSIMRTLKKKINN